MKSHDLTYLRMLKTILGEGVKKPGARLNMPGSTSLFGYQCGYNLADGFPLLTTKKMHLKGIVAELLWFLRGDTNIKYLVNNGVNIWNEDAYNYYSKCFSLAKSDLDNEVDFANHKLSTPLNFEEFVEAIKTNTSVPHALDFYGYQYGDCGFQYGKVWRSWEKTDSSGITTHIDQIKNVLFSLFHFPDSRRHLVTATDPAHDQDLALYWCHSMFQFNTFRDADGIRNLDVQLYQRSMDTVLGSPYNISSYSLLLLILAKVLNYKANNFIHSIGDAHIYDNHMEAVTLQLTREPYPSPTLEFSINALDIFTKIRDSILDQSLTSDDLTIFFSLLNIEDFILKDYKFHPPIKAELSTGMKVI